MSTPTSSRRSRSRACAVTPPEIPIRLVNCDPTPGGRDPFASLARDHHIEVIEAPTRSHGQALDRLFRETDREILLLLDSDAEVLQPDVVTRSLASFASERVFGAGHVNGPGWLHEAAGAQEGVGYFQERPWMPFVLFRTSMIREALAEGRTFANFVRYNDFAPSQRVSRLMARRLQDAYSPSSRVISRIPGTIRCHLAGSQWNGLSWLRRDYYGNRPNYVVYDTGADVYQWCKYQREWIFSGIDDRLNREILHHHGVTRHHLGDTSHDAQSLQGVEVEVAGRLHDLYGLSVPHRLA